MFIPSAAQAPLHNAVASAALAAATAAATTASPYAHPGAALTASNTTDAGGGEGSPQNGDWSSIIGITTAIVGNVLISFALNTQKYAHLRLAREAEERRQRRKNGALHNPEEMAKANAKARKILGFKVGSDDVEGDDDDDDEPRESDPLLAPGRRSFDANAEEHEGGGNGSSDAASLEAQARELRSPRKKPRQQTSYLESPYWWIGIVLMIIGEAGNFLAYGFAPASIVSPLGVVALISNCIIAPIMLKEPFRKRDALGVLISIGGAVTVVLSANDNNPKLGPHEIWELIKTWEFETYFGVTALVIIGLMWASTKYGRKSIFIDLGLVGGYTALSTKGVASMLSYTLFHALTFPVTYLLVIILVFTAVMQIKYLNRALQRFDATQVIPTQFVLFTLSVILGSAILYRDFERTNGRGAGEFVGGCAMTFLGVWIITTGRPRDDDDEEEEEEERAPEQEDAIHLGPEEYGDDEVHYGPTYSNDSSRRQSALMNELPTISNRLHRTPSAHLKRGSISLVPGPLTSPLSSSLSAVVADSLRKGVEMRSLSGTPTGGRPRRNTKEGAAGSFGGWLGGGGTGVAGPRDAVADAGLVASAQRRRSRGVSASEGEGGAGRSRSFAEGVGAQMQAQAQTPTVEGEGSGGRARSLSNPFGALLRKVRSRGEGVAEEEEEEVVVEEGEGRGD
ncbi:hypothetical protein SLS56_009532 [Neofusicoccum ribis]|uniref:DUF803 domain membrane protein n=1 Tax=Neofusicoccum ribis TaxID=45134 RepID=A0ABR3SHW8_9PEZI